MSSLGLLAYMRRRAEFGKIHKFGFFIFNFLCILTIAFLPKLWYNKVKKRERGVRNDTEYYYGGLLGVCLLVWYPYGSRHCKKFIKRKLKKTIDKLILL